MKNRIGAVLWAGALLGVLAACDVLQRDLAVTVQNQTDDAVMLEIIEAPDELQRHPAGIARPIEVAPGEHVVQIAAPRRRWALRVHGELGFLYSDELVRRAADPEFRVIVWRDGSIEAGP
ncbi:MAG: hypothetical protein M3295_08840 [Chloroflexota bacterium]|nr:hypothetical protein [Chloroflexota bacterium]